jgi:diaminopimelate epimerase
MHIKFNKYHGTGNDFIMIDGIHDLTIRDYLNQDMISHLCHRRFGIGADGLIIIAPHSESDFYMVYYNSDGRISSMCGNGSRCAVRYAHSLGYLKEQCTFAAIDGLHEGKVSETTISVLMSNVHSVNESNGDFVLDTGSPHYVSFLEDVDSLDIIDEAHKIRYGHTYKEEGINVNFVKKESDHIQVRTYERGVEDETYSCGTGVVASAIASRINDTEGTTIVDIKTKGGELNVTFEKSEDIYKNIWLTGPAIKVFGGEIEV